MDLQSKYKTIGILVIVVNITLYILIVAFLFFNMVKEQNLIPPSQFAIKMQLLKNSIKERVFSTNNKSKYMSQDYLGYFFIIRIAYVIDYENENKTPFMASLANILKDYFVVYDSTSKTGKIKMALNATNSRTLNYFHESNECLFDYRLEINSSYNEKNQPNESPSPEKEHYDNPVLEIYEKALKNQQTTLVPLNNETLKIWGYEIEARVYFKTTHRIETRTNAKIIRTSIDINGETKLGNSYEIEVLSNEFDRDAKICKIRNGLYLFFYPSNVIDQELSDADFYIPGKIIVETPSYLFHSASLYNMDFKTMHSLDTVKKYVGNLADKQLNTPNRQRYIFFMFSEYSLDVKDGKLNILLSTKVLKIRQAKSDPSQKENIKKQNHKYNYTMMVYYPLIKNIILGVPVHVKYNK